MPITDEQATEIARQMHASGFNESEIYETLDAQMGQPSPQAPGMGSVAAEGKKVTGRMGMMIAPFVGGSLASGALSRFGQLTQTAGEMGGIFAGDVAGRAIAQQPQNLKESGKLALSAGALGYGGRMLTQGIAGLGKVPRMATQEAGVPTYGLPSFQKTGLTPLSQPGPQSLREIESGTSSFRVNEASHADRVRAAAEGIQKSVTTERATKTALLKQADSVGVRVDPMPVLDAIANHQVKNAFMPDAIAFNDATNKAMDEFMGVVERNGGSLTPSQMDDIIRNQLAPKAYSASTGDPTLTRIGTALRDAKTAATKSLNAALPSDMASLNAKISEKLDAIDEADRLFGPDRTGVINRVSNIFQPGNEDSLRALNFLAKQSGDTRLVRDTLDLATRRAFTQDPRLPPDFAGRPFAKATEAIGKGVGKVAAPLQPYMGGAAAALINYGRKQKAQRQAGMVSKSVPPEQRQDFLSNAPEQMFPGMTNRVEQ